MPKILACDPARFGDDLTAIGIRQGRLFRILAKLSGADLVEVTNRVIEAIDAEAPDAVLIDADGLGAGVVDMLRHRNYGQRLFEFHGGARADDANAFYNKRAECWGRMAEWLKGPSQIPDDPALAVDLCGSEYGYSSKGQLQMELKSDLKARGLASPDLADCLMMTFSVTVRPRPKPQPELLYSFPDSAGHRWMGS